MNQESKETGKPELVFNDLTVGRLFRPLEYRVTPELVQEFMEVVGDSHPLYGTGNNADSTHIAPPGLAAIYARLSYLQDHAMPAGGVLAKQEFSFLGKIKVGDMLIVSAEVIECYEDEKRRKRVTFLIKAKNQKNELISEIHLYAIWPK